MRKIILIALTIPVLIVVIFIGKICIWSYGLSKAYDQRRSSVLVQTDHQALVAACRDMIQNKQIYGFDPNIDRDYYHISIDYKDHNVPEIIRHLEPAYILLEQDNVYIAVGCGFEHIAVAAYAEGAAAENGFKLAEGLWYYDDLYNDHPRELEKFIKKLKS